MDAEIDVRKVKERHGSLKAWAKSIDIPYTTVLSWRDKGVVPSWRVAQLTEKGEKDILRTTKAKPKRRRAA
jgi:hypothetical protein